MFLKSLVLYAFIETTFFISPPIPYPEKAFICLDINNTGNSKWPDTWKSLNTSIIDNQYLYHINITENLEQISTFKFKLLYIYSNRTQKTVDWNYFYIKNITKIDKHLNVVSITHIYILFTLFVGFLCATLLLPKFIKYKNLHTNLFIYL